MGRGEGNVVADIGTAKAGAPSRAGNAIPRGDDKARRW
jgi:hypothetical protein